jgi:putative oxidoreductase
MLGRLLARGVIGGLFVGHGTQKLFGWFDGPGLEGASKMMESLELRPGRRNAVAASVSEAAGGAMLALGLLTPVAGASLTATMITAIRTVHFKNGLWNSSGGYEFNLALIAGILAIVDGGPGTASLDHALGIEDTGWKWALACLAAGAAGSTLAIEPGRRQPPSAPDPEPVASTPSAEAAREPGVTQEAVKA